MPKYGIDNLKKFAEERGGRCLSVKYTRANQEYRFTCANGHEFSCKWNVLLAKPEENWCTECLFREARQQNDLALQAHIHDTEACVKRFEESFDLERLSDALVSCKKDGRDVAVIPEDDFKQMFVFIQVSAKFLNSHAAYPMPEGLLHPVAAGDDREIKKRLWALQAMPWALSALSCLDRSFFARWIQRSLRLYS